MFSNFHKDYDESNENPSMLTTNNLKAHVYVKKTKIKEYSATLQHNKSIPSNNRLTIYNCYDAWSNSDLQGLYIYTWTWFMKPPPIWVRNVRSDACNICLMWWAYFIFPYWQIESCFMLSVPRHFLRLYIYIYSIYERYLITPGGYPYILWHAYWNSFSISTYTLWLSDKRINICLVHRI